MKHARPGFFAALALTASLCGCASSTHETKMDSGVTGKGLTHGSPHTEVIQKGATPARFDDIEGALAWRESQCVLHQSAFDGGAQVRDFSTGEEIPVKEALYVVGRAVKDETGHIVIAFKTRRSAADFIVSHSGLRILSFDELLQEKLP